MLIFLHPQDERAPPTKLQGGGICTESLVDTAGPISVHSTTCNKGGVRYISPISVINQVSLSRGSKSKHSDKKIFRILRYSLLRNQISSLIGKGIYLSPSGEIIRSMTSSAVFLGNFQVAVACTGNSSWGFHRFFSILNAGGSPGVDLPKREPTDFVGSI